MKNILRYGRHLLHAKGRHGTHSPFVYAFVENVLRNKKRFHKNIADRKFSNKEINLLIRTIHFLKPESILVDKELLNLLNGIALMPGFEAIVITELNEHNVDQQAGERTLLISSGTSISAVALLSAAIQKSTVSILFINPHTTISSEENWQSLSVLPEVKMRLDLWYLGLLLNDPAFKASQYFRLR
ncbi:MAG: hypothetical protein WC756_01790 [Taibaiella sp.]